MSQREVTDNKALEQFLPQRGSAYQPRATPWESCHARFRVLTERRRWSHHPHALTPAPARCGAPSERIHTNHPCSGCIPTGHVPDAYPPPISRTHTHRPCPGCIPTVHVRDACPPSVFRMHAHHPCPGCMPTVRVPDAYPPPVSRMHAHRPIPRVAPWAGMRCPFGANVTWRSFRAHPYPPSVFRMHTHRPIPQGCTLGWYALPLWGKWKAASIFAPVRNPPPRTRAAGR